MAALITPSQSQSRRRVAWPEHRLTWQVTGSIDPPIYFAPGYWSKRWFQV